MEIIIIKSSSNDSECHGQSSLSYYALIINNDFILRSVLNW